MCFFNLPAIPIFDRSTLDSLPLKLDTYQANNLRFRLSAIRTNIGAIGVQGIRL